MSSLKDRLCRQDSSKQGAYKNVLLFFWYLSN
jgi:hypothetical protein